MIPPRAVRRFGDTALIASTTTIREAHGLAAAVREAAWEGVEDVVVGNASVTILVDAWRTDLDGLGGLLAHIQAGRQTRREPKRLEIPVVFDGPDIEEVARIARMSKREVLSAMVGAELEVAFLGFAPGFAYMSGLPPALANVGRRATPRVSVGAGSVALAAGFAAVYPSRSPGGWQIVGHTDVRLFDAGTPPYAALSPGDLVRFVSTTALRGRDDEVAGAVARGPLRSSATRRVGVEDPGLLSLVEDAGRSGVASMGVPKAGAADPIAFGLANRLVGNPDGAAAIEFHGSGPVIRVESGAPLHIAVVGDAQPRVDGTALEPNAVVPLGPGQVLNAGRVRSGIRAYLAIDGGVETPLVLGSRSSDILCGLGPGPLVAGDVLGIGSPRRPHGRLLRPPSSLETATLRAVAGPDELPAAQLERFAETVWEVTGEADRVGLRMTGRLPDAKLEGLEPVASRAMVTGAVQVPPDGNPIVLLCDHATVGGYPVVATVISADLGRLGQLRPGDRVSFRLSDARTARDALGELRRETDRQVSGWFPSRTD